MNPTEAWALVRWNDNGAITILGVFASYELADYQKGNALRPNLQVVKTLYHGEPSSEASR